MTEQPPKNRPSLPRFLVLGICIAGLTGFLTIVGMIVIAVDKVQTGRGLETYRTHWLVEFNWIGFLIFLAVGAVALFVGLLFRLKEWREIRQLEDKYGGKGHD